MSRDFTIQKYSELIKTLQNNDFTFRTFKDYENQYPKKRIILRHDVDKLPQNSLNFAKIQSLLGIFGTYYFRIVPESFDLQIIQEIADMGHEIGYHYETMDTCKGDIEKAYELFCINLDKFRKITPIVTFCMHGSPLSKFDNRSIWQKYDYKKLGLIAEPYFELDFNNTFYITDTGRRWDGDKVSIRDKSIANNPVTNPEFLRRRYHSTADVINAIELNDFPEQVMMTFHPQRWTDNSIEWLRELVSQNLKNQIKRFIVKTNQ